MLVCFAPCVYSVNKILRETKIENQQKENKKDQKKITMSYLIGDIPIWNLNLISIGGAIVAFIGFILTVKQSLIAKKLR